MAKSKLELGSQGEALACQLLRRKGYKIIQKNYRSRLGQIDIIARDKDILCFIEVKTRSSTAFGEPQESVTVFKQGQIAKAAISFLKEKNLLQAKARFDVVAILHSATGWQTDLIKDAFQLDARHTY